MKNFLSVSLALLLCLYPNLIQAESVSVSAIVWNLNQPAVISIISPSYLNNANEVEYIEAWTSFALDFRITDNESNSIYYTATPSHWAVSSENWWPFATTYNKQIVYLAPSSIPADQSWSNQPKITITANDWSSITTKVVYLYIY